MQRSALSPVAPCLALLLPSLFAQEPEDKAKPLQKLALEDCSKPWFDGSKLQRAVDKMVPLVAKRCARKFAKPPSVRVLDEASWVTLVKHRQQSALCPGDPGPRTRARPAGAALPAAVAPAGRDDLSGHQEQANLAEDGGAAAVHKALSGPLPSWPEFVRVAMRRLRPASKADPTEADRTGAGDTRGSKATSGK